MFLSDSNNIVKELGDRLNSNIVRFQITKDTISKFTPISKDDKKTYQDILFYFSIMPDYKCYGYVKYTNQKNKKIFIEIDKMTIRNIKLFLMIN